jgi:cell division protein ZapA (FtsZ GTPase activity inhibitor)
MARSSNFLATADLNVSAELSALREEVDKTFSGKFRHEIDALKSLSQQRQIDLQKMSKRGEPDDVIVVEENVFGERLCKLERELYQEVNRITERIDHLLAFIKQNSRRIEELEQETRSNTLIFQGVPESETMPPDYQILGIMKDKLGIFIPNYPCPENGSDVEPGELVPPYVIARAFRLGKPRSVAQIAKMGPRPLMVQFGSLFFRDKVFAERRSLKGTKMYVCESLTRPRYELLQRVKEKVGTKNAWSANGRIFAIVNNTKRLITKLEDLHNDLADLAE